MNLKSIVNKADADLELTGVVTLTEEEWRTVRTALAASYYRQLVDNLRNMVRCFGAVNFTREHREIVSGAENTLKELGENPWKD